MLTLVSRIAVMGRGSGGTSR